MSDNQRFGAGFAYPQSHWSQTVERVTPDDRDATALHLIRQGDSHRGVATLKKLNRLCATHVNDAFLEEVSSLTQLECLYLQNVTVADLAPIKALRRLKVLRITDALKVTSIPDLRDLRQLQSLSLTHLKRVSSLEPLSDLKDLEALGVEGAIWTPMVVDSLRPLTELAKLKALFLVSLRVKDRSLKPLHSLSALEWLECAIHYADGELEALHRALPAARCQWFDMIDEHGSIKAWQASCRQSRAKNRRAGRDPHSS